MSKGNLKNKKNFIKMVAMICTMITILTVTMTSVFASNSTYRSSGTTSFDCRIPIGGGKGKLFKAVDSTATLTCTVMPETRATRSKCFVYQVYVDADGNEYIKNTREINRNINNDSVSHEEVTFPQAVGKNYKYVLSIYSVKYDSVTGLIKDWPDRDENKNCVKYNFVITSLSLDY